MVDAYQKSFSDLIVLGKVDIEPKWPSQIYSNEKLCHNCQLTEPYLVAAPVKGQVNLAIGFGSYLVHLFIQLYKHFRTRI